MRVRPASAEASWPPRSIPRIGVFQVIRPGLKCYNTSSVVTKGFLAVRRIGALSARLTCQPLRRAAPPPARPSAGIDAGPFAPRASTTLRHMSTEREDAQPLSTLTDGIHLHTILAPDEGAYLRVMDSLRTLGILLIL